MTAKSLTLINSRPGGEVRYDGAAEAELDNAPASDAEVPAEAAGPAVSEGEGCHAGAEKMRAQAEASGNAELMERFEKDYPKGPHDQPQSMCPAFGSLRVGLRMKRTATSCRARPAAYMA